MSAVDLYSAPDAAARDLFRPVLSLRQLWTILWAYRYLLVAVPLVFGLLAMLVVKFVIPKTYQARATMFVAFKGNDASGAGIADTDSWGFVSTQIELMRSPITLGPVVEAFKLYEDPEFMRGYRGDGSDESLRRYAAASLDRRLTIHGGSGTRFIYLLATDFDPVRAADLANAVAESYVAIQLQQFVDPVKERIERYDEQLETLRNNVEAAQTRVAEFRQRTGLLSMRERSDTEEARLVEFERRLAQTTQQRRDAELRLRRVRQADAALVASPLMQSLRSQIQQKEAARSELAQTLGARHPAMLAVEAELAELHMQFDREVRAQSDSVAAELESLRILERDLDREVDQERAKTLQMRKLQDEGSRLLQALDSATKVYQGALDSFEQAQFGTQMAGNNVNLINRATPPAKHMPGGRKKIIMALGLGGLLAGAGCLIYELLNRRIRCRDDLENDLGIPVLIQLRAAQS